MKGIDKILLHDNIEILASDFTENTTEESRNMSPEF